MMPPSRNRIVIGICGDATSVLLDKDRDNFLTIEDPGGVVALGVTKRAPIVLVDREDIALQSTNSKFASPFAS